MQRRKQTRLGAPMIVLTLTLSLVGCVPCLHPIYTAEDVIFERDLIGDWRRQNDQKTNPPEESWEISKQEGKNAYWLTRNGGNGEENIFTLHLCRIQDKMFIDLYPQRLEPKNGSPGLFNTSFVSVHNFALCQRVAGEDGWDIQFMNAAWLATHVQRTPDAIDHTVVTKSKEDPNHIVITADSRQLQRFAIKHISTSGAYLSKIRLRRW